MICGVAASVLAGCLVVSRAAAQSAASAAQTAATPTAAARAAAQDEEAARKAAVDSAVQYKSTRANTPASSPFGAEVPPTMVSVNFPGGTVAEYVQMLREAAKDPVNIAAAEQLLTTQISGVELKNVSLMTALRALGTIGDGSGMIDVRDLSLVGKSGERVGSPVYEVIWVPRRVSEESAVMTYALFDRLPALTDEDATRMAETLVSAAQAALQMSGGNATWDLKFHRPSRLLLVKGNRSQIEVVSGVVERMTANWARDAVQKVAASSDSDAAKRLEQSKAELARETEDYRKRLEEMMMLQERRIDDAKKQGVTEPVVSQIEKMRIEAMRDAYNARYARMQRLDDQLLDLRIGHGPSPSFEARLSTMELRLHEIYSMLEKRLGTGK
jgi:hypothetical protein